MVVLGQSVNRASLGVVRLHLMLNMLADVGHSKIKIM